MESISSDTREVVLDILSQVKTAIENLMKWNQGITDMNDLLMSPGGMQDLAGNCMTIMAIGYGGVDDQGIKDPDVKANPFEFEWE